MESRSVWMFNLASPCCVQPRFVTYVEVFSGITTPKSKRTNFLLAARRRQNMPFVFFCFSFLIERSADGEHVQQGGECVPQCRHGWSPDPPGATRRQAARGDDASHKRTIEADAAADSGICHILNSFNARVFKSTYNSVRPFNLQERQIIMTLDLKSHWTSLDHCIKSFKRHFQSKLIHLRSRDIQSDHCTAYFTVDSVVSTGSQDYQQYKYVSLKKKKKKDRKESDANQTLNWKNILLEQRMDSVQDSTLYINRQEL